MFLETVQAQHHRAEAGGLAAAGGVGLGVLDGQAQRIAEAHPVRQAGEAVGEGQVADLGLLGADVLAHHVHGLGQLAHLVVVAWHGHGLVENGPRPGAAWPAPARSAAWSRAGP